MEEKVDNNKLKHYPSETKHTAGRPHYGTITGVLPEHREEVEEIIIEWFEKKYFHSENPTGIKALAERLAQTGLLISHNLSPLSAKTIEQELGEIRRRIHAKEIEKKKKEKSLQRKKKEHMN